MSHSNKSIVPTNPGAAAQSSRATASYLSRRAISQIRRWWAWRGGWNDFLRSPYSLTALLLMIPTAYYWLTQPWWDLALSILPSIIGFSLGGYAILLAFGDEGFRRLLVPADEPTDPPSRPSRYMQVSSIFLHFILTQLWALTIAVMAKTLDFDIGEAVPLEFLRSDAIACMVNSGRYFFGFLGFWLFLYALGLAAAASLSVFGLSEAFEAYLKHQANHPEDQQKGK